jgi:hypothetical protein
MEEHMKKTTTTIKTTKKIDNLGKWSTHDMKGVAKRFPSYANSIQPTSGALLKNRNSNIQEFFGSLEDLQHFKSKPPPALGHHPSFGT